MKAEDLVFVSKNSPVVAFHRFVLLCSGREEDLFCFFEGIDCRYYSLRIKQNVRHRTYHPILCGNKGTVINVYKLIQSKIEYKEYHKCFFVDSDFDEKINNPDIYETPFYSVENFYVNTKTLHEILINEFGLIVEDEPYKKILEIFKEEIKKFNSCCLLFNAWYATLKEKKRELSLPSTNVCLEDTLPKNFIFLKIGEIKSEYDLDLIKLNFPEAIEVAEELILKKMEELQSGNLNEKLRGKYLLWFLYKFLQFLILDANSNKKILKSKTRFNIDKSQILSQLSQYAITTECLVRYLQKYN